VILCGGLGSRLGALTKGCPKPLLKIQNRPLLEWQILLLKKYGVREIYINLHYLGEKIVSRIGDGQKYGLKIFYKFQDILNGTVGGVKVFEKELEGPDPFFVLYGDVIFSTNISKIIEQHNKTNSLCTIYLHRNINSNSFIVCEEKYNKVKIFYERPTLDEKNKIFENYDSTEIWANSSIYLMCPSILKTLLARPYLDFPRHVFPSLIKQNKLYGMPINGQRFSIDTKEKYKFANQNFSNY